MQICAHWRVRLPMSGSHLFIVERYSIVWIRHSLFIHSLFGVHLGCFQWRALLNKAAIDIGIQVALWTNVLISLPPVNIVQSLLSCSKCVFNSVRISPRVFLSGCTTLHSYPNVWEFQVPNILPAFDVANLFNFSCSNGYEIGSQRFQLAFP